MLVGIIGSGNIGGTLAAILTKAGYSVLLANSRGPESLAGLVAELGPGVSATTPQDAAERADLVIEAIPFGRLSELPLNALAGKVLITASNYYPGRDGNIDLAGATQSEYLDRMLPDTHIAKVFNTIYWEQLRDEGDANKGLPDRRVLPFAASDEMAESAARDLILALGFGPLFLGDLSATRGVSEPEGLLYNRDLTLAEAEALL